MMNEREKSDSVIVAMTPVNEARNSAAEPEERRTGTKGNVGQQSTRRAQDRESVSQALSRVRKVASGRLRRQTPEVGAGCPNWARPVLCGGRSAMSVPTANASARAGDAAVPAPASYLTKPSRCG